MKRFKPNIIKNILISFIIVVFIFIANIYTNKILGTKEDQNKSSVKIGGNFNLIDQNGNNFSSTDIKKIKIIYFGYTFCPDVCPFDILKLSNFYKKRKDIKRYIQPIFITVDPERDKPDVLKNFLENFEEGIIGLTGSMTMVNKTLKDFKVYKKKSSSEASDENYLVDHTALFYILDKNDNYIDHLGTKNFEEEMNEFLKKVNLL